MNNTLDEIDHFAINVADIERSIKWYQNSFKCEVVFQNNTQAVLKFANVRLTLVLPSSEKSHISVYKDDAASLGTLRLRDDGLMTTFISDPTGNMVELVGKEK